MLHRFSAISLAIATLATATQAQTLTTGPSTSSSPYVQGLQAGTDITSILTTGDSVGGYRMAGIPDGLGAFDNGNGTFTVLMNHEIGSAAGAIRAHGGTGAFVSSWVIDKATLAVQSGGDLIQRVYGWDSSTQSVGGQLSGSSLSFQRFCSADLAATSAYSYTANGVTYGTTNRIFLNGEEVGTVANSRAMAHVATGSNAGSSFVLGKFNTSTNGSTASNAATSYAAYENLLANPYSQLKTIVIGNNDGGTGVLSNAVSVYVGTKQATGNDVERAGLTNGVMKFVKVDGVSAEINNSTTRTTGISNGARFSLSDTASTTFSRPEDGAWSADGKTYYFVTTDRLDNTELTTGTQKGATRLWSLSFDDIANPEGGGKIDLLIDGGTSTGANKPNMFDNISVNSDGTITLLEDTGNAAHNGKMWQFDPLTKQLVMVAKSDTARFGDVVNGVFVPGSGQLTQDEETSGVIDVTSLLGRNDGKKYQLFVMQNHAAATGPFASELVEGGQLMMMSTPAVPEPGVYALLLSGLGVVGVVNRRRQRQQG